jgi:hypothetical protein
MKSATVRRSATDKLRFEISAVTHGSASGSGTSAGSHLPTAHNQQKWYVKANHVAEVNRWCVALERAIEWGQRAGKPGMGSPVISGASSMMMTHSHSQSGQGHGSESEREGGGRSLRSLVGGLVHGVGGRHESGGSKASSLYGDGGASAEDTGSAIEGIKRTRTTSSRRGDVVVGDLDLAGASGRDADSERFGNGLDEDDEDAFGDADDREDDDSGDDKSERVPPHEGTFEIAGNTVMAQVEIAAQLAARVVGLLQSQPQATQGHGPLLSSAASTSTSASTSSASSSKSTTNSKWNASSSMQIQSIHAALLDSLTSTQRLVSEFVTMSREREGWWKGKLERERERGEVWEESLRVVVKEGEELERELRKRLRGEGSGVGEFGMTPTPSRITGSVRRTPSLALSAPLSEFGVVTKKDDASIGSGMPPVVEGLPQTDTTTTSVVLIPAPVGAPSASAGMPTLANRRSSKMLSSTLLTAGAEVDESVVDTDEEDEFFDAIESNTLPNVLVPDALAHQSGLPKYVSLSSDSLVKEFRDKANLDAAQYEGYANLRTKLPIEKDTRPPTSLWSVLKHSIGKDLTRISFPVFFNEPTSMLQRMVSEHLIRYVAIVLTLYVMYRLRIWNSRNVVSITVSRSHVWFSNNFHSVSRRCGCRARPTQANRVRRGVCDVKLLKYNWTHCKTV